MILTEFTPYKEQFTSSSRAVEAFHDFVQSDSGRGREGGRCGAISEQFDTKTASMFQKHFSRESEQLENSSAISVPFQSDFLPFSTPFVAFTVDNAQPSACLIKLINDGNEEVHGWMDWRRERGGDKSCIRPQFNRSRMLPCHSLSSNFTQGHVLTTTTSIGNN